MSHLTHSYPSLSAEEVEQLLSSYDTKSELLDAVFKLLAMRSSDLVAVGPIIKNIREQIGGISGAEHVVNDVNHLNEALIQYGVRLDEIGKGLCAASDKFKSDERAEKSQFH